MDSFTGNFQGFYLDFKDAVLSPPLPPILPHVLTEAPLLVLAGWLDNTEQSFLMMVEENNF